MVQKSAVMQGKMMGTRMGMRMGTCLWYFHWAHVLSSHSTPPSLKTLPPSPARMTLRGSIHTSTLTPRSSRRPAVPSMLPLQVGGRPFAASPVLSLPLTFLLKAPPSTLCLYTPSAVSSRSLHLQVPPPLPPLRFPKHTPPAVTLVPSQTWCESRQVGHHAIAPMFHPSARPSSLPKVLQVQS